MTPASVARPSSSPASIPAPKSTQRKYPPSGRLQVARPASSLVERGQHRVALGPQDAADPLEVGVEGASREELVHDRLRQERR